MSVRLLKEMPKGYQSVRLPADVVQMARTLASIDETITIADLIAEVARPILREKLQDAIKRGAFLPKQEEPPKGSKK